MFFILPSILIREFKLIVFAIAHWIRNFNWVNLLSLFNLRSVTKWNLFARRKKRPPCRPFSVLPRRISSRSSQLLTVKWPEKPCLDHFVVFVPLGVQIKTIAFFLFGCFLIDVFVDWVFFYCRIGCGFCNGALLKENCSFKIVFRHNCTWNVHLPIAAQGHVILTWS